MQFRRSLLIPFCLVIIALCIVLTSATIIQTSKHAFNGISPTDFPNYYFAGKRYLEGRQIYSPLKDEVLASLGHSYAAYPADPPLTVILLSPLAIITYSTAWWILITTSVIAVLSGTYLLSRTIRLSIITSITTSFLVLVTHSNLFLLKQNHMESLLYLLLCLALRFLVKEQWHKTKMLFGLIGAIKLFPALLIFIAAKKSPLKATYLGILIFLICSIVSCVAIGYNNLYDYISWTIPQARLWLGTIGNYSIASLSSALNLPIIKLALLPIILVVIITNLNKKISPYCACLSTICASLLLSPLAWLNYLILIIPPAIVRIWELSTTDRDRAIRITSIVVLTNFWPTSIDFYPLSIQILFLHGPTFLLLLLMLEPWLNFKRGLIPGRMSASNKLS